jgi:phage terminase Nu1 subunit (DNA packaging protein)
MSSGIIVGSPALATFFGVKKSAVANWASDGMPKLARNQFDLKLCFDWWLDNIFRPSETSKQEDDSRERYWSAKADREEMSRDQTRGDLMPKAEIGQQWAWRSAELRASLRALASRLPQRIDGLDIHDTRAAIRAECDAILNA